MDFFNLSKAFDVVNNHLLLGKLLALYISLTLQNWVVAFFIHRQMRALVVYEVYLFYQSAVRFHRVSY